MARFKRIQSELGHRTVLRMAIAPKGLQHMICGLTARYISFSLWTILKSCVVSVRLILEGRDGFGLNDLELLLMQDSLDYVAVVQCLTTPQMKVQQYCGELNTLSSTMDFLILTLLEKVKSVLLSKSLEMFDAKEKSVEEEKESLRQ